MALVHVGALMGVFAFALADDISLVNLRTEYMPELQGLDILSPHFSWQYSESNSRMSASTVQSGYEITVFEQDGTCIYNQTLISTALIHAVSSPLRLQSNHRYTWTVITWRLQHTHTATSWFRTGLLNQGDWQADWIQGGTLARTTFSLTAAQRASTATAIAFVSACQYYELYINGQRIGSRVLDVGMTSFATNRTYATLELDTNVLQTGLNAVALMLGQGFCQGHQGLLQMVLQDSQEQVLSTVVTNTSWLVSVGPVCNDSTYYEHSMTPCVGETYLTSNEQPGWTSSAFTPPSPHWAPATLVAFPSATPPYLNAQLIPPIAVQGTHPAVTFQRLSTGVYMYDFGQELAGWASIYLPPGLPANLNITLKHTEALLHPPFGPANGSVWMGNLFWAYPVDHYVTRGQPSDDVSAPRPPTPWAGEYYEPRFTYHGFRYVQVEVYPPTELNLSLTSVQARHIQSNVSSVARMHLADDTIQRVSNNSWWTESAALMSIPAGCAGRGERSGWTADAAFAAESEMFDFDSAAFFLRWMDQIPTEQCPDGQIANGVPGTCGSDMDPSWSTVYPTVAWNLWRYYNVTNAIRKHYPTLQLYMTFLDSKINQTGLQNIFSQWGDWNAAWAAPRNQTEYTGPSFWLTLSHVTAAASAVQDYFRMADMATAIGEVADAEAYLRRAAILARDYHEAFYDVQAQWYGDGTLTAQALAWWMDLVPTDQQQAAHQNFEAIAAAQNYTLASVGFIGVRYIFEALAQHNLSHVAVEALRSREYPSFGYSAYNDLEQATSLWESFDASTMHQWVDESSRDHHYQTSINTFVRKYLVGLDMPKGAVAWGAIQFKPWAAFLAPSQSTVLPASRIEYNSPRGWINLSWSFPTGQRLASMPASTINQGTALVRQCAVAPQYPVPAGGLVLHFPNLTLGCPSNKPITGVEYAYFGMPLYGNQGWFCFGSQLPPTPHCQVDVRSKVAAHCVNKTLCTLTASQLEYGNPCNLSTVDVLPPRGYQLIARVQCPASEPIVQDAPPLDNWDTRVLKQDQVMFQLNATVPIGSEGEVHVPLLDPAQMVLEGDTTVYKNGQFAPGDGVQGLRIEGRYLVFGTTSGSFNFQVMAVA